MGGVPHNTTPIRTTTTPTTNAQQPVPQAAAPSISTKPPALYSDFTDSNFAKNDNAKNSQKDMQQFYNGQYTHDWQELNSAESGGDKTNIQQAETRLAADIASLHNLEKQFYVADGDPAHQASKYDAANFTQEGTTEQLLQKAGAPDSSSTAYTFTGVADNANGGTGIQVTAKLNANPGFQAAVAPLMSSTNGQVNVQSSYGQDGKLFDAAANTGSLVSGSSNTATTYYVQNSPSSCVATDKPN